MTKKQAISEATRESILQATFKLVVERGSVDLTQTEIAAAAGVSRQTIFLAFGGRPGLLVAMMDYMDAQSPILPRLAKARQDADGSWEKTATYLGIWVEFLECIFPVAILLTGPARIDATAAQAYWDRMHGRVRMAMRQLATKIQAAGNLREGLSAEIAGDIMWTQVQPPLWQLLVVETGWTPEEFVVRQKDVIRRAIMA